MSSETDNNASIWLSMIEMESVIDGLIQCVYLDNDINSDLYTHIMHKKYGLVEFTIEDNCLLVNFKNCKKPNTNISLNDECSVCYDKCNTTLKCGHFLCSECIKNWLQPNDTCPICRNDKNYKFGYIFRIPIKAVKSLII